MKRLYIFLTCIAVVFALTTVFPTSAYAEKGTDASGVATGNASDVSAAVAGEPTTLEVAEIAGHNKVAINMMWVLLTGFLVMFMQAGFSMVEAGLIV